MSTGATLGTHDDASALVAYKSDHSKTVLPSPTMHLSSLQLHDYNERIRTGAFTSDTYDSRRAAQFLTKRFDPFGNIPQLRIGVTSAYSSSNRIWSLAALVLERAQLETSFIDARARIVLGAQRQAARWLCAC